MPDRVLSICEVIKNVSIIIILKRQLRSEKLYHSASSRISRVQIKFPDYYISATEPTKDLIVIGFIKNNLYVSSYYSSESGVTLSQIY